MSILGLSITDTKPVVQGAGFWIRALARVIDLVYGYVMGAIAGFLGGLFLAILTGLSIIDPGWQAGIARGRPLLFVTALLAALCYHSVSEGLCGASLGKLICGLHVLSEDCSPCGLKQALIRSLAYYFDSLFFGAVGYLEMKKTLMEQRHGDRWAKTLVVRSPQVPAAARPSRVRYLLSIALASAAHCAAMAMTMIGLGLGA